MCRGGISLWVFALLPTPSTANADPVIRFTCAMACPILRRLWLFTATAAALLGATVQAADQGGDKNRFLFPTKNSTFHYLDTVNVAYTTDYDEPWLYLYCWDANDARQGKYTLFVSDK